jgi:mannosyltransferase OCH1-like enzyme
MVNSEFTRRQLHALDGLDSHIDTVFPASSFLLKDRSADSVSMQPHASERPIELLFVGRVVPHKGHRHILSVAAAVQRFSGRRVKAVFAGALEARLENYWSDLRAIAIRLGVDVEFPGLVSEETLKQLYRSCDAFICMSEHEGFGMPVFEAMRSRVPVVAWSSSAMVDLLAGHPFADSAFQIHRFAACVLAALEPGIRQRIVDYQDYVLAQYTYDSVRTQLIDAMTRARGEEVDLRERMTRPEPMPVDDIAAFVASLSDWLEDEVGTDVETFMHDASVNYMGLYDIAAHNRLIAFLRDDHAAITADQGPATSGDLNELHRSSGLIRAVMGGEDAGDAIHHVNDLLAFDDEVFIRLSFQRLLGRDPDLSALGNYLRRLRSGQDRRDIVRELARSDEARRHGRVLPGVEEHIDQADDLERLENAVGRIRRYLVPSSGALPPYHPMGSIHHVDDLLQLNDVAFVDMSYRILLGRAADPDGMNYYCAALCDGMARHQLLANLAGTDEGAARIGHLDGLSAYLARPEGAMPATLPERLARLGNELGQLTNQLAALNDGAPAEGSSASGTLLRLAEAAIDAGQDQSIFDGPRLKALLDKASDAAPPAQALDPNTFAQPDEVEFNYVHQILITANGAVSDELPPMVRHNVDSLRRLHPEAEYRLWGTDELRRFIAAHFEAAVLETFDTLQAYALKADLARYCLLYVHGGLYSDLSNRFLSRWRIKTGMTVACFREHKPLHGALWMNQNTIIYAAAGQAEIKLAIDLVVENVRNRDYGVSSLAPSGPVLFGRALAVIGRANQYQIGEAINVQVEGSLNRSSYVDIDGTMIATRLQGGGGKPSEIGLRGTNVYGEMWDRREIYGEGVMFFAHDNVAVTSDAKQDEYGVHLHAGATLALAPFALPRGLYTLTWRFAGQAHGKPSIVTVRDGDGVMLSGEDLHVDESGHADHVIPLNTGQTIVLSVKWEDALVGVFKDVIVRRVSPDPADLQAANKGTAAGILAEPVRNIAPINHIHHVLYGSATSLSGVENGEIAENLRIAGALYPDARQMMWTEGTLRDFIAEHFAADVVSVYDRMPCHANRSELGRYCLLYALGGLYIDPWLRLMNPIDVPSVKGLAGFRSAEVEGGASWGLDPALLYAAARQPEFEQLIDQIVDGARAEAYGMMASSITGSERLGRILAVSYDARNYFGGEVVPLTRGLPVVNDAFVSQDGRILAVRKGRDGPDHRIWQEAARAWREGYVYSRHPQHA